MNALFHNSWWFFSFIELGGGVRFTCVSQGMVRGRILFPNLLSMAMEYFHIERTIFRNKYQIDWYWYNTPSEPVLRLMASSSITFLRYFQSQHYWRLMMIQRNDPLNQGDQNTGICWFYSEEERPRDLLNVSTSA